MEVASALVCTVSPPIFQDRQAANEFEQVVTEQDRTRSQSSSCYEVSRDKQMVMLRSRPPLPHLNSLGMQGTSTKLSGLASQPASAAPVDHGWEIVL